MKSEGGFRVQKVEKPTKTGVPSSSRPKARIRYLRGVLALAAICFCFSSLWTFSGSVLPRQSPWSVVQEKMIKQTIGLIKSAFDFASHFSKPSAPTDTLCWPETRNLPPRTRLGISADEAFLLDSLCLPHYLASLSQFLETSGLNTEEKARKQLKRFLAHSWVGVLFSASPPTKLLSVPSLIYHSTQSPTHATWSRLNSGYVLRSPQAEERSGMSSHFKTSSNIRTTDTLRRKNPLELKKSHQRLTIARLTSLFNSGGIYAEDQAECLRPFNEWITWNYVEAGGDSRWSGGRAHYLPSPAVHSRGVPSFVVGVETTVSDSQVDWATKHSRPLIFSELAFASAPGHPILLDMIRRLSLSPECFSVVMTDAVLQYVTIMTEGQVHWSELRDIPPEGLRFGDLLILSSKSFATDVRSVQTRNLVKSRLI
ncbi:hypothetical protein CROQUDRAFT_659519 [Cronartium quercuum f. sp. fusiforme G11]|uniref:Uncharacterized protein n=1 Tax=Cronartium quercuum f. sp. fusiforme G11 TaxID=708437 RepID=A0A9P6NIV4_9BASI|nr:hypothetical protein CROQUDRAFT_659519 [Cronartium quercuum f. sp. fusiforme G11]